MTTLDEIISENPVSRNAPSSQNIILLLYVYKKLYWHHIRHKHLNTNHAYYKSGIHGHGGVCIWGANHDNEHGKVVEKLIDCHNLILLNDSVHTRFDTFHQTSSSRDLSLCHPSIYMDVACEVSSNRLGSDHHPIIITANTSDHPVPERVPKWKFKKAKWDAFQDQCITEITPDLFNDAEDKMAIFSITLLDIAAENIPKTSPFPKRKANLGLMKIIKQLKSKEVKLID